MNFQKKCRKQCADASAFQSRNTMFEQAEKIRKERPVTAEDMSNIVVNYLTQTGLDEKAQKILKKLCLQMFKGTE